METIFYINTAASLITTIWHIFVLSCAYILGFTKTLFYQSDSDQVLIFSVLNLPVFCVSIWPRRASCFHDTKSGQRHLQTH